MDPSPPLGDEERALLERYVAAFEAYDIEALTSLIQEDATQSMPPFDLWLPRRHLHGGSGRVRLPRLAARPDCRRERLARVRPVQARARTEGTSRGRSR